MATITAIRTQKRHPDRVNIELDEKYAFSVSSVLLAGIKLGQDLDARAVAALQVRDADESAFQRSLRLISRRNRSEAELRTYLRKNKTPDEVIERTLVRLRKLGHADDAGFARAWVDNRGAFRPRGRRALAWELRRKGLSAEVIEAALANLDEAELAYQAGQKKARHLASAAWPDFKAKLSAYLVRRGFPAAVSTPAVFRIWTETHGGNPANTQEATP